MLARDGLIAELEVQPGNAALHVELGSIYAALGDRDNALNTNDRAVQLLPASKDVFDGAIVEQARVLIGAMLGARAQGKKLGRPRVSARIEEDIRRRRAKGLGIQKIAREVGVGVSVVQRVVG
jgi:hypothetical protein